MKSIHFKKCISIFLATFGLFFSLDAQPVWESYSNITGDATSIVISKPTGTVQNNLMVAAIYLEKGTGVTVTPPSGWTLILSTNQGTDFGMRTYYKLAGASEGANYTFNLSTSGKWAATISRISGVDIGTPIGTAVGGGGNSVNTVSPVCTTNVANSLVLSFHGKKNNITLNLSTGPVGTVKQFQVSGIDVSNVLCTFVQPTAGTTGNVTTNGGGNTYWNTQQIPIRPNACIPPSFSACPSTTNVNTGVGVCTAEANYTATATGSPSPTLSYVFSGATTGSGSGTGSGSTFNLGTTTVTITATNGCSPNATCVFNVVVADVQAPSFTCPSNLVVNTNNNINCEVTVPDVLSGITNEADNCSAVTMSQSPISGSTQTGIADGGTFQITVTATDGATPSNSSTCVVTVTVNDDDTPTLSCPSSASINPTSGSCEYTISGTTYDPTMQNDNCGIGSITNNYNNLSSLNGAVFNPGPTTVIWTITDINGLTNSCSFTLTINPCVTFSGNIYYMGNGADAVKDVTMTLSGDAVDNDVTAIPGSYSLIANMGDDFVITPTKTMNVLNGLDVADATRISQHMSGNYMTDFYRKVSADVNKSSTISTADAAIIKQALLGNLAATNILNNTGSWRFVSTDFNPQGSSPFVVPAFSETRTYTSATGNYTSQDFYAIKVGDVLNSSDPQGSTLEPIPSMVWMARDRSLMKGEILDVEFSVQDWKNISAFQYSIQFDPSILAFEDLEMLQTISDFDKEGNFGISNVQNGELRIIFSSTSGSEVEDASKVFKLRFKVLQSGIKLSNVLSLSNTILNPIAYTEELISTELKLIFTEGSISNSDDQIISEKIELLQNHPNPFSDFTSIGFILPTAMEARLNIYDASGRMIWNENKSYPAGFHEEKIRLEETLPPGVYFYELTTQHGSQVKRMILIRE